MKPCAKCRMLHDRYRDRLKTKHASYCEQCHAAHMRATRPRHSQLKPEARRRANVRALTRSLQTRGKIIPQPCSRCQFPHAERHHPDYNDPKLVEWLCRDCHMAEHATTGQRSPE